MQNLVSKFSLSSFVSSVNLEFGWLMGWLIGSFDLKNWLELVITIEQSSFKL